MSKVSSIYKDRCKKVYGYMKQNGISLAVFEDCEESRCPAVRYLCGHPSDAVLILSDTEESFLFPWDENLAKLKSHADSLISYTKVERKKSKAIAYILKELGIKENSVIALSPETTHLEYLKFCDEFKNYNLQIKEDGIHNYITELRAVKDEYEIECTKKACAVTDEMTLIIVDMLKKNQIKTETDVALFIEKYLREKNCEKTSFETLAAGPERSYAIHAFPCYTSGAWGTDGLSILDYGVCYEGYASDCTITVAKGNLSNRQKEILNLVQKAADECIKLYKPGLSIYEAAKKADEIFASCGMTMPHSLGHGTGLEIHEAPYISMKTDKDKVFKPGNIVTLEPGLYDIKTGGVRLENDVLITPAGNQLLTNSKIFYI